MTALPVTIADIRRAAATLEGAVAHTPTIRAAALSELAGCEVYLKLETMQSTGSFKERGALNKLLTLDAAERRAGVVAMSAGNHAQGVAYHARRLGIPATIVMPAGTPFTKIDRTEALGATVVLKGNNLVDARRATDALARERGLVPVHPYDDPLVIAGQGTIALEMLEDAPDLDVLVVPIGGGGIIAGCAVAARAVRPSIEIVGVECSLYPGMRNALTGEDRPVGGPTLAEGIAVKNVGALALPIVRALVSDVLLVEEAHLERAVNAFLTLQKTIAEGAGSAGLAALLANPQRFAGRKVGLILCGGNIDPRILASVMVRELEREDRIVSFRLTIPDRPGVLGQIATRLGQLGANILEVEHRRLFLDVPAKGAKLDVTVETRDRTHAEEIMTALAGAGYSPVRIDPGGDGLTP